MKFTTAHKRVNGATDKISELINRLFVKKIDHMTWAMVKVSLQML